MVVAGSRPALVTTMKTACLALFLLSATAAGAADAPSGPPAGFTIETDYSEKSPDGTTTVEQYKKIAPDESYNWQFWAPRRYLLLPRAGAGKLSCRFPLHQ